MAAIHQLPRSKRPSRLELVERQQGELRLARYARSRNPAERDELVRRYMPLARSAAARYRHTSESFEDLLQVAALGLLKAIDRYDPSRGFAFSSFAVPTILGELRRHLRDHTWSVRVPRPLQELTQRLRSATDALAVELGREPTISELANRLGVTEEEVLDGRQVMAAQTPASLDEPTNQADDFAPLVELLGSEDSALAAADDAIVVEDLLRRLPARSREVLRLRFEKGLKQREIGELVGLSQMHVSRTIRDSLAQLRAMAAQLETSPASVTRDQSEGSSANGRGDGA
jgi:RNA polymerase sigma-B factor